MSWGGAPPPPRRRLTLARRRSVASVPSALSAPSLRPSDRRPRASPRRAPRPYREPRPAPDAPAASRHAYVSRYRPRRARSRGAEAPPWRPPTPFAGPCGPRALSRLGSRRRQVVVSELVVSSGGGARRAGASRGASLFRTRRVSAPSAPAPGTGGTAPRRRMAKNDDLTTNSRAGGSFCDAFGRVVAADLCATWDFVEWCPRRLPHGVVRSSFLAILEKDLHGEGADARPWAFCHPSPAFRLPTLPAAPASPSTPHAVDSVWRRPHSRPGAHRRRGRSPSAVHLCRVAPSRPVPGDALVVRPAPASCQQGAAPATMDA